MTYRRKPSRLPGKTMSAPGSGSLAWESSIEEIEDVMTLICDNCCWPYLATDQERMTERCDACPIEAAIRSLINKEE